MNPESEMSKCEECFLEDGVDHDAPVAKRKRLELHKCDNIICKAVGMLDLEQEKNVCNSDEVPTEKECEKDKCDETCQYEYGKAVCKCVEEFKNKECEKKVDTILLPSSVSDKEEIYFPDNISNEDPSIYGKWLIFTNGNLILQNHLWIQLQNLVKSKDLILLGSSTAKMVENRGLFQGVIKCYTSKDINVIRRAGLLIQNILKDDTILDYKTNEASQNNLFRANGNRFITKFMLTVNGKLYKRDKLCRWTQIIDAEYENFIFEEKFSENVVPFARRQQSESNLLPSLETRKKRKRYVYPDRARIDNLSGLWCLFCNVTDVDANGLTELDRAWNEAKALRDKSYFKSITCETYALQYPAKNSIPRRTVMCEISQFLGIDLIIKYADELREKVSYNMPIYYKTFLFNNSYKPEYKLKYLYTEDRELYEYTEGKWQLLKRA